MNETDTAFIQHLAATTGLPASTCKRLVLDILAEYDESLEGYVQRRHHEIKAATDLKNEQIYAQILAEIPQRRFTPTPLTLRQVRRLIYG